MASKSTKRKALEAGTGLLLWVSMVVPTLRPGLAEFYTALFKDTGTCLSLNQLAEMVDSLTESWVISRDLRLTPVKAGWRLLQLGSAKAQSKSEALTFRTHGTGRIWASHPGPILTTAAGALAPGIPPQGPVGPARFPRRRGHPRP